MDGSVTPDCSDSDGFFDSVQCLLDLLQTEPIPLDKMVLPQKCEYLEAELARRQASRKETETDFQRDSRKLCFAQGSF